MNHWNAACDGYGEAFQLGFEEFERGQQLALPSDLFQRAEPLSIFFEEPDMRAQEDGEGKHFLDLTQLDLEPRLSDRDASAALPPI